MVAEWPITSILVFLDASLKSHDFSCSGCFPCRRRRSELQITQTSAHEPVGRRPSTMTSDSSHSDATWPILSKTARGPGESAELKSRPRSNIWKRFEPHRVKISGAESGEPAVSSSLKLALNTMLTFVPLPMLLFTSMVASISLASSLVILKPRPVPAVCELAWLKGVNKSCRTKSSDMPIPVSSIEKSTRRSLWFP